MGKWVVQVNSGAVRYADGDGNGGDTSFDTTLSELRDKRRAFEFGLPLAVLTAVAVFGALWLRYPLWIPVLLLLVGGAATYFARTRDVERRSAVMHYELDRNVTDAYTRLLKAAKALDACSGKWHLVPATIGGGKDRAPLHMHFTAPEFLQTNVPSFAIRWRGETLHFFPDRVLVYEENNARAISYRQLQAVARTVQVPEDNTPPDDAKVVGKTWRYVDANGQKDANHPVNRELPLVEYGEIEFTGAGGLHETVQCSKLGAAHTFADSLRTLASLVPDSA